VCSSTNHLESNATLFQAAANLVSTDFTWVEAYVSDPSFRRLDLHLRKQPLHTRLSPAIAGLPGDDVSDISIVRREWIEQAAVKEAASSDVKHLKCVIILGCFSSVAQRSAEYDSEPSTSMARLPLRIYTRGCVALILRAKWILAGYPL
jgi:hypothetical protein